MSLLLMNQQKTIDCKKQITLSQKRPILHHFGLKSVHISNEFIKKKKTFFIIFILPTPENKMFLLMNEQRKIVKKTVFLL